MKKWKGKAVALTLLLFALYVLFNHPNLNPLYPEAAFLYCVLITVLVGIFTLDKLGRVVTEPGAMPGVPGGVHFVKAVNAKRWPVVLVGAVWAVYLLVSVGSSFIFQVNAFRDQMPTCRNWILRRILRRWTPASCPLWTRRWPASWRTKSWASGPAWAAR